MTGVQTCALPIFSRALLNLCLNALQSMARGGILRIAAERRDGWGHLSVTDSGTGIAPEDLPHVFDPYFTTKPDGVGLGLANVHKIIEAHQGQIEVSSTLGIGTTFEMLLPLPGAIGSGIGDGQRQSKKVKDSTSAGWSGCCAVRDPVVRRLATP